MRMAKLGDVSKGMLSYSYLLRISQGHFVSNAVSNVKILVDSMDME